VVTRGEESCLTRPRISRVLVGGSGMKQAGASDSIRRQYKRVLKTDSLTPQKMPALCNGLYEKYGIAGVELEAVYRP